MSTDWQWFGTPGHFIAARSCCFHLHTRVGDFRVSTVGCYHPGDPERVREPKEIGSGRFYETMVFALAEGEVVDWVEVDSNGYMFESDAERGHLAMCAKCDAVGAAA